MTHTLNGELSGLKFAQNPFYGLEFPDRLAEIRSGCFYGNN